MSMIFCLNFLLYFARNIIYSFLDVEIYSRFYSLPILFNVNWYSQVLQQN